MDRAYVVENDIVARYLQGKLGQEECEAFEAFFLEDEETLEELELLKVLRSGGDVEPTHASPKGRSEPTALAQVKKPRGSTLFMATAASLAIGFFFGASFADRNAAAPAPGSISLLNIETLRSSQPQAVFLPPHVNYAAFRVAIGIRGDTVDLTLAINDRTVARVSGLVTDGYGEATFVVPTGELSSGTYRIFAMATTSQAIVFDSLIKLTRE